MSWAKLDDAVFAHPKIVDLPCETKLAFIASIVHCARELTDGRITKSEARIIMAQACQQAADRAKDVIGELVTARLWEDRDGAYWVHDYLDYNPSKEQVLEEREAIRAQRSTAGKRSVESRRLRYGTAQPNGSFERPPNGSFERPPNGSFERPPNEPPNGAPNPESRIPNPVIPDTINPIPLTSDDVIARGPRSKKFVAPTDREVASYFRELKSEGRLAANGDEARMFFNRKTADGWMYGKTAIRDWRASARYWLDNAEKFKSNDHDTGGQTLEDMKAENLAAIRGQK